MNNLFNDDFRDFILAFNETNVDYILVGGFSVVIQDIWVRKSPGNYAKIVKTFSIFGMPVFDMSLEKFLEDDGINVFYVWKKTCSY